MSLTLPSPASGKEASTIIDAQKRANARRNAERYEWARRRRAAAVRLVKKYVDLSDEELWQLVPGQTIPRAIHIHSLRRTHTNPGCPVCGTKVKRFGNYPYKTDMFRHPWKIQCPSCKGLFPKNDFGRYYESGIGDLGVFDPAKADQSLLFNADHPDPKDPKHKWLVDDGYGAIKEPQSDQFFIAYYAHWGVWYPLRKIVGHLATAYALTEDPRYAHKAAVVLDRIADVFPSMDIEPYAKRLGVDNSDGGSGKGYCVGRIWQTGHASALASAIDTIWDGLEGDQELVSFLHAQALRYDLPNKKSTLDDIKRNLLDHIVREVPRGVVSARMVANEGGCQLAVATAAIVLDEPGETEKWLDWLFTPAERRKWYASGHLPALIEGMMCRDGVGAESAPGYSLGWSLRMKPIADLLRAYEKYDTHDLYRDFPKIKECFKAPLRMVCLGKGTPNIGDSGKCGSMGRTGVRVESLMHAFDVYRDPFFAQAIYEVRRGQVDGLVRDIFTAEPEGIGADIRQAVEQHGPWQWKSENMTGYGLSILHSGAEDRARAFWLYWGRSVKHGHADRLNIGFLAKQTPLLPDLGYPEYTGRWPKRRAWTANSLSHNVVIVDDKRQRRNWGGQQVLFVDGPPCQVVEVQSANVYPGIETYQRLCVMIDVDETDSYVVDLYRVAGGSTHLLSFHANEGEATASGLELVAQAKGTYAGEDVAFGQPYDGNPSGSTGFSYLYDVKRDAAPPDQWSVDWRLVDAAKPAHAQRDLHLRLTMATPTAEVALAHGDPPQNKRGNPRRLRYLLARRRGENLRSLFASVIEPYEGQPLIRRIERLPVAPNEDGSGMEAICLKIELANGAVDYAMSSIDLDTPRRAVGGPEWTGRFAWCRVRDGRVVNAKLTGASRLSMVGTEMALETGHYAGTVDEHDREMDGHNCIYTSCELPSDGSLCGKFIHIKNDGQRDASYRIEAVRRADGRTVIDLGETTFVRGYRDSSDYSKGLRYNFRPGDKFLIWNAAGLAATR